MISAWGVLLRDAILGGSFFAAGLSLYLAFVVNLPSAIHKRLSDWYYVLARVGFSITIGLVAERVLRVPLINADWRVWLYIVGLSCASIGYFGIAYCHRKGRSHGA
jgi:hypothetical protein